MVEGSITIGAFTLKDHSKSLMSKKTPNAIAFEIPRSNAQSFFFSNMLASLTCTLWKLQIRMLSNL